ncbi:unnamed protein product [Cladocopium goreaui]|uniref:Uncharacterized protein n=1 Tax=Cladocopium goreaui TaxID=2562237 RepID=A0A9P1FX15_9DINO|nr:unnamed protein product [Cladocopium goreaui]
MLPEGDPFAKEDLQQDDEQALEILDDYFAGAESAKRTARIAQIALGSRHNRRAGELLLRIASTGRTKTNVDRNLRRCIHKAGVTMPVDFVLVPTTVQILKPKLRIDNVFWPTLSMKSWVSVLAESCPQVLLGGFRLEESEKWRNLFGWFWDRFEGVDRGHPIYEFGCDRTCCIPIMVHGDEGRGLRSQAFMVESWQFVISHLGPFTTNTSGHSFTSRLLFTCISSKLFDGEKTLRDLNDEFAKQLRSMFFEGVQVGNHVIRLIWIATKGDWPFLRKACSLFTGFTSLRICHLCSGQDWWRYDSDAPWKLAENRPGESPFKPEGNPFAIVPGGDSPNRIRPDMVHTFHIGFGVDLAASFVVWLCKLGKLGSNGRPRQSFDDKLSLAYSTFREYCHIHKRFTACDHWSMKKLGMTSTNDFPTSLGGKGHDTGVVCRWLDSFLRSIASW